MTGDPVALADYVRALFAPEDAALQQARSARERAGMPAIAVPPETGRFLQVLLTAIGARRVLEIGTLGGTSAIWMARAMGSTGRIVSLEIDPAHAAVAQSVLADAGLGERVEIRVGRALDLLPTLAAASFDAAFLDADKESLPAYLEAALRLVRPGGLVIADNALRAGRVLEPESEDAGVRGVQEFNRLLARDPRITGTVVPVGDGVAVGVVRA